MAIMLEVMFFVHFQQLADVLRVNTTLAVVNLESNRITRKGIAVSPHTQHTHKSTHSFTNTLTHSLTHPLSLTHSLTHLLTHSPVSNHTQAIMKALAENEETAVTELRMANQVSSLLQLQCYIK